VNITVRLKHVPFRDLAGDGRATRPDQLLLVCDRCHDIEAIVVAIMQILPIERTWALCGACEGQLPAGFNII
jgi:hypothetical protein